MKRTLFNRIFREMPSICDQPWIATWAVIFYGIIATIFGGWAAIKIQEDISMPMDTPKALGIIVLGYMSATGPLFVFGGILQGVKKFVGEGKWFYRHKQKRT